MNRVQELEAQSETAAVQARKMLDGTIEHANAWLAIMEIEKEIVKITTPESEEGKRARIDTISCAVHAAEYYGNQLAKDTLAQFISEGNVLPETIERIRLFLR